MTVKQKSIFDRENWLWKYAFNVSWFQSFGKKYENDLSVIFDRGPKLIIGFNVQQEIQILKVILYLPRPFCSTLRFYNFWSSQYFYKLHVISYFLPAPLVALFTVPVIGHWSDICTSKWGRRRPFIFGLSIFLILSLVLLCIGQNLVSTKGSSSTNGWAAELNCT